MRRSRVDVHAVHKMDLLLRCWSPQPPTAVAAFFLNLKNIFCGARLVVRHKILCF